MYMYFIFLMYIYIASCHIYMYNCLEHVKFDIFSLNIRMSDNVVECSKFVAIRE